MADVEKDIEKGLAGHPADRHSLNSERSSNGVEKSDIEKADDASIPRNLESNERAATQDEVVKSIIVDWDGPDDPERPPNFPLWRKFLITISMAGMTLVVTFSSSVFSAATVQTAKEFNVSEEVMVLGTSLFILGFGIGPTFIGPLSELWGRKIPLFAGFIIFAIFQIPVAVAQNIETIMVCRFFQGFFGSSPPAVIGGALADFWDARQRGFAMPSFAGALFAGPVLAPVVGTYLSESHLGWRWTQWITLIMSGLFGIITLINMPETYAPVLLSRKAARLRRETGDWRLHSKHDEKEVSFKQIAFVYGLRPAKMVVQEPILLFITLYLSFVYGLVYLFFESYPISFGGYRGWSPGIASLPFISILMGVFAGCALLAFTTRTWLAPDPKKGRPQEQRLITMIMAGMVMPIGLFWFAWTSSPHISPWPEIIAGIPIGFSIIVLTLQGINYLIDCYTIYSNSAIAVLTFVRCWFGAGFPLFAGYMFKRLGVAWATSVLGFISVAMIPIPVIFFKYGATIRSWSRYKLET